MASFPTEKLRIGTSGYSYDDWRGVFYPEGIKKGMMLEFYARYFDTVEMNSTYYAIPGKAVFYHLDQKTPPAFEFIVKCHQDVTHRHINPRDSIRRLMESMEPLILAGKMQGLLSQFPFSFKNKEKNRAYLRQIREWTEPLPLFFEFRHQSWQEPVLVDYLKSLNAGYVNVDLPPLKGLPQPDSVVSNQRAYIRFHGRNTTDWWSGTNETRYNYHYSDSELREWLKGLKMLFTNSRKFFIFFNNHPRGHAIQNAKMLHKLIKAKLADIS